MLRVREAAQRVHAVAELSGPQAAAAAAAEQLAMLGPEVEAAATPPATILAEVLAFIAERQPSSRWWLASLFGLLQRSLSDLIVGDRRCKEALAAGLQCRAAIPDEGMPQDRLAAVFTAATKMAGVSNSSIKHAFKGPGWQVRWQPCPAAPACFWRRRSQQACSRPEHLCGRRCRCQSPRQQQPRRCPTAPSSQCICCGRC